MNWNNYIENFKYYLKIERGLSENSIKSYVYDINKFSKFLVRNDIKLNPTNINIDLIKEFLYATSGKIKSRSQSRQISSLKSFFSYLVFENIIKTSPIDIIDSLIEKSVEVSFYDPFVDELIVDKESIPKEQDIERISNYDMVIIHTPHTTFNDIDFEKIKSLIFDTTGSFTISNAERI